MLLGIAGITGAGKSFFKDRLVESLSFEKIRIVTTRSIRVGEINNSDKIFVTDEELNKLRKSNKIAYEFEMLGNKYAYLKEELFSNKNIVFELHYNTIYDFKKICPHLCWVYILPTNVNIAKEKLLQRHLDSNTEIQRLKEIDEHIDVISSNQELREQFDYFFNNNYDNSSEINFINLVRNILIEKNFS